MKHMKQFLAVFLSILMVMTVLPTGLAAFAPKAAEPQTPRYDADALRRLADESGYDLTEEELDAIASGETTLDETLRAKEADVTLIVQLSADGALTRANGLRRGRLNASARRQQSIMASQQADLQERLAREVFDGESPEVLYSYSLLTNAFALQAKLSDIDAIAALDGVESVYTAPVYTPVPTDAETDAAGEKAADFFTGSDNTTAYTGKGALVAVIDTGLDLTHPAFAGAAPEGKLTEAALAELLPNLNAYKRVSGTPAAAGELYVSGKVPFAFNYSADQANSGRDAMFDVSHKNDDEGDHGTHVSGIIAGWAANEEGEIVFSGVAPEAQIAVLKVFGADRSGSFADILAAVEDAVTLGADVINLSLGAPAGFTYAGDYPALETVYQNAAAAGVVVSASAGNEYSAGYGTKYGTNLSLASNPDNGIVGSPASYDDNLAVASVASKAYYAKVVSVGDRGLAYTCNATEESRNIEKFSGQTLPYVLLQKDGRLLTGTIGDFENNPEENDVKGKLVVVRRGQTFTVTAANAAKYGAIGLIVCDNVNGSRVNMMENTVVEIPAIFVSKADGDYLESVGSGELTVSESAGLVENPAVGQMSEFSSWGVTPDLQLKPEITGYGGNVYSTRDNGTYGLMSGTSMSAPYVSGVAALVAQRMNEAGVTAAERRAYAAAVMMSTASPVVEASSGVPYSPRKQGAGLVNIDVAMASNAYIKVEGSAVPKLSLGDDKEKTGVYELAFDVVNTDTRDLTFTVSGTVQTEKVEIRDVTYPTKRLNTETVDAFIASGRIYGEPYHDLVYLNDELKDVKFMSGLPYDLSADSEFTASTVTVPAGETAHVTAKVTLGESAKAYLDENFENGIYVEGFVTLTSLTEGQPDLNVPYLSFYGDWTRAPMLDEGNWEDELAGDPIHPQMSVSTGMSSMSDSIVYTPNALGTTRRINTPYEFYKEGFSYVKDARNVFALDSSLGDNCIFAELGLLRSARSLHVKVTNEETGEVYKETDIAYAAKSRYVGSDFLEVLNAGYYGRNRYQWSGLDADGRYVPAGTTVRYEVTAYLDYGEDSAQNNARNTFSFIARADADDPRYTGARLYRDADTNDLMLEVTAEDDTLVASIKCWVYGYTAQGNSGSAIETHNVWGLSDDTTSSTVFNLSAMMRSERLTRMYSLMLEGNDFSNRWFTGGNWYSGHEYYLSFYDNMQITYDANVMSVGKDMWVSQNYIYGKSNTGSPLDPVWGMNRQFGVDEDFLYESSNPSVATVTSGGLVRALSPGYTTISVTGGYGGATSSFRLRVINSVLQAEIDETPAGGTLNYTGGDLTESLTIDRDLTLDLGGATVTAIDGAPALRVNGGNVTVTNGTLVGDFANDSENPLLQDILQDTYPTVYVTGGSLTLDGVQVSGALTELDGTSVHANSAVKLTDGAALTVKDSSLFGLYGVNNKDGGTVRLVSGRVEGLLGSVADLDPVSAENGSVRYDVTNGTAADGADYAGSADGSREVSFSYPSYYRITAQQIAAATGLYTQSSMAYNEEKNCAVLSVNKDQKFRKLSNVKFRVNLSSQPLDASKYRWALYTTGGALASGAQLGFSANTTYKGSAASIDYYRNLTEPKTYIANLSKCTNYTGNVTALTIWPTYNSLSTAYYTGAYANPDSRIHYGDVEIYDILFFETRTDLEMYLELTENASTTDILTAKAQTVQAKLQISGNTVSVNALLPNETDGSYRWAPKAISLVRQTANGDGTVTETVIETKPVSADVTDEIDESFTVEDPSAVYTVKVDFELQLLGASTADHFTVSEEETAALLTAMPDLIADQLKLDEMEEALIALANYFAYDLRAGLVHRDERHYDCPLRPRDVAQYPWYDEYPDIICTNTADYPTWTAYFDQDKIFEVVGSGENLSVLGMIARELGDAKVSEIMAALPEVLPGNVFNSLDENYRVGHYGYGTGALDEMRAFLADFAASAVGANDREKLAGMLTWLSGSFDTLVRQVKAYGDSLHDPNVSVSGYSAKFTDPLVRLLIAKNFPSSTLYNRTDNLSVMIERIGAVVDADAKLTTGEALIGDAFRDAGVILPLLNYKDVANTTALLSTYFDGTALPDGVFNTGALASCYAETTYDGLIEYALDGGVNDESNPTGYQTALPVALAAPVKTGYRFDGWFLTPDLAPESLVTTTAGFTGDVTLYAKWTVNTHTITFISRGETVETLTFNYGEQTRATAQLNAPEGMTLKYWYETRDDVPFAFGLMPDRDIVLTAQYGYITLDDFLYEDGVYHWNNAASNHIRLIIDRDCTGDFGGVTLTNIDDLAAILVKNGAKVTIRNAVIVPSDDTETADENCSLLITEKSKVTLEDCQIQSAANENDWGEPYTVSSAVRIDSGELNIVRSVLSGLYAVNNVMGDSAPTQPVITYTDSVLLGVIAPFADVYRVTAENTVPVALPALIPDEAAAAAAAERLLVAAPVFNADDFTYAYDPDADSLTVNAAQPEALVLPDGTSFTYVPAMLIADGKTYPIAAGEAVVPDFLPGTHALKVTYVLQVALSEALAAQICDLDDTLYTTVTAEIAAMDDVIEVEFSNMLHQWNEKKDQIMEKFYRESDQFLGNSYLTSVLQRIRDALDILVGKNGEKGLVEKVGDMVADYKRNTTDAEKLKWMLENKTSLIGLTQNIDRNVDHIREDCELINGLAMAFYGTDYTQKLEMVYTIADYANALRLKAERLPSVLGAAYAAAEDPDAFVAAALISPAAFTGDKAVNGTVDLGDFLEKTIDVDKVDPVVELPGELVVLQGKSLSDVELPEGFSWENGETVLSDAGEQTFTAIYTPENTDKYNVKTYELTVTVLTPAEYCARFGHDYEVSRTEPTCTEDGLVRSVCRICGDVVEEILPAFGHTWNAPVWTWDDLVVATASFTCQTCGETVALTADIGSVVTREPTCTVDGATLYTAVVELEGQAYKTTRIEPINAFGHTFGEPVWGWNGTASAVAIFTCATCGEVVNIYADGSAVVRTVDVEPTTVSAGSATYTATVTFAGKTYTNSITGELPVIKECLLCGKIHTGFLGDIVKMFHNILYVLMRIFGIQTETYPVHR